MEPEPTAEAKPDPAQILAGYRDNAMQAAQQAAIAMYRNEGAAQAYMACLELLKAKE